MIVVRRTGAYFHGTVITVGICHGVNSVLFGTVCACHSVVWYCVSASVLFGTVCLSQCCMVLWVSVGYCDPVSVLFGTVCVCLSVVWYCVCVTVLYGTVSVSVLFVSLSLSVMCTMSLVRACR